MVETVNCGASGSTHGAGAQQLASLIFITCMLGLTEVSRNISRTAILHVS